jgi:hypothetical protein
VFDDVTGMTPAQAARWTALVEECRPVLANEGMEAVQTLLNERGVSTLQAIVITRALMGRKRLPLRDAVEIVTTSSARAAADGTG